MAEAVAAGEDVKSEEIKQLAKEKKEEEHCKATMDVSKAKEHMQQ